MTHPIDSDISPETAFRKAGELGLPPERVGKAPSPALLTRRQALATAVALGNWKVSTPVEEIRLGGVRSLRIVAQGIRRGTVLHLHGGAFRLGCPEMILPFAAALAAKCRVDVVCPAYRLAPEHPFPAGLVDARAVFSALGQANAAPLVLSGDSAGGGLAASLAALCVAEQPRPQGLVLLSPWLDLTVSSPSYRTNAAFDPLFSLETASEAKELYLQGLSPLHPLASPLHAPLAGYPPTFISIGEQEVLADDGIRFSRLLRTAGSQVTLHTVAGMEHVAVTRNLMLPGARETFDNATAFLHHILDHPG